jgi:2-amino-4-hydroxy-6-hydroxymethyldihydropteridine diphosphokinase
VSGEASGPGGEAPASHRRGYLSLGSNLGDRRLHLQAAVDGLGAHGLAVLRSSSVYDTEPIGLVLDQPEFLNACLEIDTALEPLALLDVCKAVERKVGRDARGVRHGPRVIDVDVLLLGELTLRSERLNLPHEDLTDRRFVLVPLLELAPDLMFPGGERLAGSLAALGGAQEVRLAGPPLAV